MKEVLLTSSVLILAVFLVRRVFKNAISRRVQYALWGLVLVRLLLPFNLPAMEHNVLTAAAPVQKAVETEMEERMIYALPTKVTPYSGLAEGEVRIDRTEHTNYRQLPNGDLKETSEYYSGGVVHADGQITRYYFMWPLEELLTGIWYLGMVVMALWLLISNFRFDSKLRKARRPYSVKDCKYPVYMVDEGLPSPCLFGLVRPAIYLTPAAAENETTLRHVLAHETTHARHLDPLWAVLRGVCLVVYWFDPLVWAAAFAFRTDCELACDEGALNILGEEDRIPYGKTLLSLIPVRKNPVSPLLSATTMTSDKKKLTERIKRIAENRQSVHAAIFLVAAIAVVVCAMTFTGAKTETPAASPEGNPSSSAAISGADGIEQLSTREINWFNTEFFNGDNFNIHNQFLSALYGSPEQMDLFDLFYTGGGVGTSAAQEERELVGLTYYDGYIIEVDCTKVTSADMNAVLLENTGLTLEQTRKKNLDQFDYLAQYDAYYHFHGDTNYYGPVTILSGEREGNVVRLYYTGPWFDGDALYSGWKCVTLEETEGGYWFVSNLATDPSVSAIKQNLLFNSGEPDKTVKLSDLTVAEVQDFRSSEYDIIEFDINGDGIMEFYFNPDYHPQPEGTPNFCFEQDGTTYGVDLREAVKAAYPEWDFFNFGTVDDTKGCICLTGSWLREDGAYVCSFPELYFTGEEFLFYEDHRETIDHVVEGVTVTGTVLDAAKEQVQQRYEAIRGERSQYPDHDPAYDDWRIEYLALSGVYPYDFGVIQVYNVNYEFHASQPAKVGLAGGMYHRSDDWVMPGYPYSMYLYFAVDSDGKRLLHTAWVNDAAPGVDIFDEEVDRLAESAGLVDQETPLYEEVIDSLAADSKVILQLNGAGYITEQTDYWNYRVRTLESDFTWEETTVDRTPTGNFLTIGNLEMGVFLRCWENSNLIQVMFLDETAWYTATSLYSDAVFDGRAYSALRQWFDHTEWNALIDEIVIENRGQSYQEIAQEWADRYAQAHLNVTSGSQFACTYARAVASIWDWVPETAYPASTEGKERFYFGFTRVFVPEKELAYYYQMAGNTTEYDGSLGEAPEGACMDGLVGPMYLSEDGWRCDGVGTGI